jgi:hypothetical protein
MKKIACSVILVSVLLLAIPLSGYAGGSSVSFGIRIGAGYPYPYAWGGRYPGYWGPRPYWGPRYYWGGPIVVAPYPYYAPPPTVVVPEQPPVYAQPEQPQENYWYYCQNPQGYYPYVKSCPGGWMKVVPQPTSPNTPPNR